MSSHNKNLKKKKLYVPPPPIHLPMEGCPMKFRGIMRFHFFCLAMSLQGFRYFAMLQFLISDLKLLLFGEFVKNCVIQ